jgi:octaheme c-type cytochrome (tetrathionate reductase family)
VRSNEPRCAQCHIGYGFTDETFDFEDPTRIDCLVCHDTTGTYKKDAPNGGRPVSEINLAQVAQRVGRPSRGTCGACHFYGGGGPNVKHGDLEPALVDPPDDFDVHMGKHDMRCQDCHTTRRHRIAGQCLAIPTSEGRVHCEQCHGDAPHRLSGRAGVHLDRHVASVSCQMCHVPSFAKETPTKLLWDWSKAGQDLVSETDEYGMPTFAKKKGAFVWGKDVNPCYTWYDGTHTRTLLGEEIDPDGVTLLNRPVGAIEDPRSRLFPFKCYKGVVPYDARRRTLVVPNLWQGFWKHFDWRRSIEMGMEALGEPFSGEVGWTRADMYWGINHEVVPAEMALRCADCHSPSAVRCDRCHGEDGSLDIAPILGPLYPDGPRKWSKFESFGYEEDPAVGGGRFRSRALPGAAPWMKEEKR